MLLCSPKLTIFTLHLNLTVWSKIQLKVWSKTSQPQKCFAISIVELRNNFAIKICLKTDRLIVGKT